jgi:hypothetical protein
VAADPFGVLMAVFSFLTKSPKGLLPLIDPPKS